MENLSLRHSTDNEKLEELWLNHRTAFPVETASVLKWSATVNEKSNPITFLIAAVEFLWFYDFRFFFFTGTNVATAGLILVFCGAKTLLVGQDRIIKIGILSKSGHNSHRVDSIFSSQPIFVRILCLLINRLEVFSDASAGRFRKGRNYKSVLPDNALWLSAN